MRTKFLITAASIILLLQGCSVPKFSKPKMDLPAQYYNNGIRRQTININWWKNFNDNNLNKLIEKVLKNNDDLKLAVIRVEDARAYLGFKSANLYPNISASASGYRQKTSNELLPKGRGMILNNFAISSPMTYEIDLWGKLKYQKKAAFASLLAIKANKETVKLSLISNAANLYFNIIAVNRQLKIAQDTLKSYNETYKYRKREYKYGAINELVVFQAKAQYENAKVLVESLKEQNIVQMSALSMLLGKSPKEIFNNNIALNEKLPNPIKIPDALASTLLNNRPDIKAAEENLRAKNLLIGAAKAAYFPSISLTGLLGFQSEDLSNLIRRSANIWGIGPAIAMPIFDFGRIKSNVKIAEAQKKAAVVQYKQTVKNAFKEVFNALNKLKISKRKIEAQSKEAKALKKVLYLSKKRFDSGYSDYLSVLYAERGYFAAKLKLVSLDAAVLTNQVTLYKALGGGWSSKDLENRN